MPQVRDCGGRRFARLTGLFLHPGPRSVRLLTNPVCESTSAEQGQSSGQEVESFLTFLRQTAGNDSMRSGDYAEMWGSLRCRAPALCGAHTLLTRNDAPRSALVHDSSELIVRKWSRSFGKQRTAGRSSRRPSLDSTPAATTDGTTLRTVWQHNSRPRNRYSYQNWSSIGAYCRTPRGRGSRIRPQTDGSRALTERAHQEQRRRR